MAERILVLGGIRSGKSEVAERLVAGAGAVVYVATGSEGDPEMAERIAAHRARRPPGWTTLEATDLARAVGHAPPDAAVLVDDLGGWLLAAMTRHGAWPDAGDATPGPPGAPAARAVRDEVARFWEAAAAHGGGPVVVVASESGLGLVPADAASRRWLDLAGAVLQQLARDADRVLLVVAGRVVDVGGGTSPVVTTTLVAPQGDATAHGDVMVPPGARDFAVNVWGAAPPPHVVAALEGAVAGAARYPDESRALAAVAARHHRPLDEVCLTAGAADAFWLLARVLRARRAVCVHPSFTEPEAALRSAGVAVEHVVRRAEDAWRLDPAAVPDAADLVLVGNPNNPTGTLDAPDAVAALCRPGRVTVVDEAFMDFVADPRAGLASRRDLPGLVVVRSVTKLWGLAGVRAGYLLAPPGLVTRCRAARPPWSVSAPALAALAVTADDEAYRREVAATVAAARERLRSALAALPGVRTYDGAANFLLIRVPDGPAVHRALLARGIAVRPSTFPGLDADHLRIAVRGDAGNEELIAALRSVLAGPVPAAGR